MSLDFSLHYTCDGNELTVFDTNITHNLGNMAEAAGIYKCLWRPDENGMKYAKDISDILEKGFVDLKKRPEHYKKFDAPNGWGTYKHFVPFVQQVWEACLKYPNAEITVSR